MNHHFYEHGQDPECQKVARNTSDLTPEGQRTYDIIAAAVEASKGFDLRIKVNGKGRLHPLH
jgi:hypothetical protein